MMFVLIGIRSNFLIVLFVLPSMLYSLGKEEIIFRLNLTENLSNSNPCCRG